MDSTSQLPQVFLQDLQEEVAILYKTGNDIACLEGVGGQIKASPGELRLSVGYREVPLSAVRVIIVKDRIHQVIARWFRIHSQGGKLCRFGPNGMESTGERVGC